MKFHLGDILSITTGRLVSNRHMDGVYDILNFMTGDNLFTHQLPRASLECASFLKGQFPQLDTPEMDIAVSELSEMLETPSGRAEPAELVAGWLAGQVAKYGEWFEVSPLPPGQHEVRNPIIEAEEMMGPEKVISVVI